MMINGLNRVNEALGERFDNHNYCSIHFPSLIPWIRNLLFKDFRQIWLVWLKNQLPYWTPEIKYLTHLTKIGWVKTEIFFCRWFSVKWKSDEIVEPDPVWPEPETSFSVLTQYFSVQIQKFNFRSRSYFRGTTNHFRFRSFQTETKPFLVFSKIGNLLHFSIQNIFFTDFAARAGYRHAIQSR